VLPRGFVRIRHFGFLAGRRRGALVPLCKQLLSTGTSTTLDPVSSRTDPPSMPAPLWSCPLCGGPMILTERLTARQIKLRSPPLASHT
jgi:hypothetical protein